MNEENDPNRGGGITFSVPVQIDDSDAVRTKPADDGSIRIGSPVQREVLRLCSNGDIFVRGVLAENDRQVVDGMREFLRSADACAPTMKLFLVDTQTSWSSSRNLVEAESEEAAIRIVEPRCSCTLSRAPALHCTVHGGANLGRRHTTCEPIELRGTSGVRWSEEESPDSPREAD